MTRQSSMVTRLPITRMLTAKWVGRIFWDDSEKGQTRPSGLQEHPWWRPVGPGPPRWLSCPHQDLQPQNEGHRGTGDWDDLRLSGQPLGVQVLLRVDLIETRKNQSNSGINMDKKKQVSTIGYQIYPPYIHSCNVILLYLNLTIGYHLSISPTINRQPSDRGTRMGLFFVLRAKTLDSDESVGGWFGGWDPRVP